MAPVDHALWTTRLINLISEECPTIVIDPIPGRRINIMFKIKPLIDHFRNGMFKKYANKNWKGEQVNPKDVVQFLIWNAKNKSTKSERANLLRYIIHILDIPRDEFGFPNWNVLDDKSVLYKAVYPERWEERTMEKIIFNIWNKYHIHIICQKEIDGKYFDACSEDTHILFEAQEDNAAHQDNYNDIVKKHSAYMHGYDIIYIKEFDEKRRNVQYYKEYFKIIIEKIEGALLGEDDDKFQNEKLVQMFIKKYTDEIEYNIKCKKNIESNHKNNDNLIKQLKIIEKNIEFYQFILSNIQGNDRITILEIFDWISKTADIIDNGNSDDHIISIEKLYKLFRLNNNDDQLLLKNKLIELNKFRIKNNNIFINVSTVLYVITKMNLDFINSELKDILEEYMMTSDLFYKIIIKKSNRYHKYSKSLIIEGHTFYNEQKSQKDTDILINQIDELNQKLKIAEEENQYLKNKASNYITTFIKSNNIIQKSVDILVNDEYEDTIDELKNIRNDITDNIVKKKFTSYITKIRTISTNLNKFIKKNNTIIDDIQKIITIPSTLKLQKIIDQDVILDYPDIELVWTCDENHSIPLEKFKGNLAANNLTPTQINEVIKFLLPSNINTKNPEFIPMVQFRYDMIEEDDETLKFIKEYAQNYKKQDDLKSKEDIVNSNDDTQDDTQDDTDDEKFNKFINEEDDF